MDAYPLQLSGDGWENFETLYKFDESRQRVSTVSHKCITSLLVDQRLVVLEEVVTAATACVTQSDISGFGLHLPTLGVLSNKMLAILCRVDVLRKRSEERR